MLTAAMKYYIVNVAEESPINDSNIHDIVEGWFSHNAMTLKKYGHISTWDVSMVTDFDGLFEDKTTFNEDISDWRMDNAVTARGMFKNAISFDQPVGKWKICNLIYATEMFNGATSFNQPIGNWVVKKLKDAAGMFRGAISFEYDLKQWKLYRLCQLDSMFDEDYTECHTETVTIFHDNTFLRKEELYKRHTLLFKNENTEVYQGTRRIDDKDVVIKVSLSNRNNLQREYDIHKKLHSHPNIPMVYEIHGNFIVMEMVKGETLLDIIERKGKLKCPEAKSVICKLLKILSWCHEQGYRHSDIKAENVMLCNNGDVNLIDFGLAVPCEDSVRSGTLDYMSPEIMLRESCNEKTDIWSVGILWFELLRGHTPFGHLDTIPELKIAITNKMLSYDMIDNWSRKIIDYTLNINRDERPSADQLLKYIEDQGSCSSICF